MRKVMTGLFLGAALMAVSAVPAAAQGTVGVGLSFLHDDGATATGLMVDYSTAKPEAGKVAVGLVGDLGLNHFDGANVTSFLGGVRVAGMAGEKASVFGQFLIGAEHCCGSTDLAFQPGVGVDIPLTPTLNFRFQLDFRTVRFAGNNFNEQRYTFGVSLPIGSK